MGQKLVVGPFSKGFRNDVTPFNVDNDSFPTLINAYQWRQRIKRKRGTQKFGRLTRAVTATSLTNITLTNPSPNILNLFTLLGLNTSQPNATIVPGNVTNITIVIGAQTLTDTLGTGTLAVTAGNITAASLNYATGNLTLSFAAPAGPLVSSITLMRYYPNLPVMGLEPLSLNPSTSPGILGFDTTYSYSISLSSPYPIHNSNFYNNPTYSGAGYPVGGKTAWTPFTWNLEDYQQIWTTNYQGALWAVPGTQTPTPTTSVGMQYKIAAVNGAVAVGAPVTDVDFTTTNDHPFVAGDWIFVNEFTGGITGLNMQTGFVLAAPAITATTFRARFPTATIANGPGSSGIIQALTTSCQPDVSSTVPTSTKDCIRWYNGDPVNSETTPTFSNNAGWVNFCPPLLTVNVGTFSISDLPPNRYYLVGARMVVPFKDRLLFFGPIVQTSTAGSQVYLQDTIIYSQNGTPYYTCSFPYITDDPSIPVVIGATKASLIVPTNQSSYPYSWIENANGFGGSIPAGYARPITSVSINEDALIVGFADRQARVLYTGNDVLPFSFYIINSELGSDSTFSTITLDRGVLSVGGRGFILTSQVSSQRIDLEIPDEVFEIKLTDKGDRRICAQRDFIFEWVQFTYPSNEQTWKFPNRTLQYNYREGTWGMFDEAYTTYGTVRVQTGLTWATLPYSSWASWNQPWNAGSSTLLQPQIIAGNQQGYVMIKDVGTGEGNSLYIRNISFPSTITGATNANPCVLTATNTYVVGQTLYISDVGGMTQLNGNTYTITAVTVTTVSINVDSIAFGVYTTGGLATPKNIYSPYATLNEGDFIVISGCLGTIASEVNGNIFQVANPTENGFDLSPDIDSGTYLGGGEIQRMYRPIIQTKQFPMAWDMGRKTRIGAQQYLLTYTDNAQITLQIYLSQNADVPYTKGNIVPTQNGVLNNSLVYSQVLYTCPELEQMGLSPANINLQTPTADQQDQIWHRMNTSLLGDTVQIGFTLSDEQMRAPLSGSAQSITGATKAFQCVLTCAGGFSAGQLVYIESVAGMTELNGNNYVVVSSDATTVTINVDSRRFTTYSSGGTATLVPQNNQFAEIELHSMILDCSPSQLLV